MIFLDNQTDKQIPINKLEEIADKLTSRDVELIITDDTTIAQINREHRGISTATDVLSFPVEGTHEHLPLGSIIISYDHVESVADALGHTPDAEILLLFIHGMLHLSGYDHEIDDGQMRLEEHRLVEMFHLPESLIIRTQDK